RRSKTVARMERSAIRDQYIRSRDRPRVTLRSTRATKKLRPKALRRSRDRRAAAAGDLHHGKPTFIGAVGAESEQAVDAGKARRVGQRFRRKTLAALLR